MALELRAPLFTYVCLQLLAGLFPHSHLAQQKVSLCLSLRELATEFFWVGEEGGLFLLLRTLATQFGYVFILLGFLFLIKHHDQIKQLGRENLFHLIPCSLFQESQAGTDTETME